MASGAKPQVPVLSKVERGAIGNAFNRLPPFSEKHPMHKPWKIYATYPTLQSRQLASYALRADAEQDAIRYRQMLSRVALIRVVWSNEHEQ